MCSVPKRRRLSRWPASVAVALALLAVAGCGEDTGSEGESTAPPPRAFVPEDDTAVETAAVPDVSYEDGQDAVDAIEAEELTATHDEDDPAGCTVEDQDPVGGTEADPGSEVVLTLDCSQRDWENREGDDWDEFVGGYEAGWTDGCEGVFDDSPDGRLFANEQEFTSFDCPSPGGADTTDVPADVPDDPSSVGRNLGVEDGCEALFDDVAPLGWLYYGEREFTSLDCP